MPRVHDEERRVSVTEVIVVLAGVRGIIVGVRIVQRKCICGIGERFLGAVPLSNIVVDNLGSVSDRTTFGKGLASHLMIVVGMEDGCKR